MDVSWDPAKAKANLKKHGIRFCDAEMVLYDPLALTMKDDAVAGEQRFVTLGSAATGSVLTVVYTYRHAGIRIISARRATRREIRDYERGI